MNIEAYIRAADRGDFKWQPIDTDDWTGKVLSEECTYKGIGIDAQISGTKGDFEIEVNLENEPYFVCACRSTRKLAREFAERIIRNDREGNWQNNLKYAD